MSMGIGENIKRIRTGMGLSQKAFGDLIGKSESQIGSYENEKRIYWHPLFTESQK